MDGAEVSPVHPEKMRIEGNSQKRDSRNLMKCKCILGDYPAVVDYSTNSLSMASHPLAFYDREGLQRQHESESGNACVDERLRKVCEEEKHCCDSVGHQTDQHHAREAGFPGFFAFDALVALFDGFNTVFEFVCSDHGEMIQ